MLFCACKVSKSPSLNKNYQDTVIINPPYISIPTSGPKGTQNNSNYVTVKTFYATNRNRIIAGNGVSYGKDRSTMHYGICNVSIPRIHKIGILESPSMTSLEFNENPDKHIVILNVSSESKTNYYNRIKEQLAKSSNNAFVFVHGYNVSFSDAARRAAQICYDLDFKGIPVFFSWPSQQSTLDYKIDENNNEWSVPDFKLFLKEFSKNSNADNIYLIAHSMGSRMLTRAMYEIYHEEKNVKKYKEIIIAAPDIDAEIFKRDLAPILTSLGKRVTLYASSTDKALSLSKKVNGYQRAGDSGKDMIIIPNIETIDATNVDTDFLGHSYFATSRSIIDDIFYLINNDLGASKRNLLKNSNKSGIHWGFKP